MWWRDIATLAARFEGVAGGIDPTASIDGHALLDESSGPVVIGPRTRICRGAVIHGPAKIGADCLIGNNSMLRGPLLIGDGVRIGYATELKNALIEDEVAIGPMCFVADSRVDEAAYLGAMVRTSNQRLDRMPIAVREGGTDIDTGIDKLGCHIGARASLGIQVIILPGRVVAPDSLFEPRITISRNLPSGRYRIAQQLECVS